MPAPTLIYCAAGNVRLRQIALDAGWRYGAQLPNTVYGPVYFADQDWRKPDRAAYIAAIRRERPTLATVLDWEEPAQLPEVLAWAEEIAPYVEEVIIVPKVISAVHQIPRVIGGKPIRLGYSVPTRFAGTQVPVWEFVGWPVHLLGGSPQAQMRLRRYLDVRSADGNYAQKMAVKYGQFWQPGTARYANNRWWPRLREAGCEVTEDVPYEAFRRSCAAIYAAWHAEEATA